MSKKNASIVATGVVFCLLGLTRNDLDKTLVMEAWMLLPGYKEPVKTIMAPVWPHLMGIEPGRSRY